MVGAGGAIGRFEWAGFARCLGQWYSQIVNPTRTTSIGEPPARPLRLRVLIRRYHPVIGGMERQCQALCRRWSEAGAEIEVWTRHIVPGSAAVETLDGALVRRLRPGVGADSAKALSAHCWLKAISGAALPAAALQAKPARTTRTTSIRKWLGSRQQPRCRRFA